MCGKSPEGRQERGKAISQRQETRTKVKSGFSLCAAEASIQVWI